MLTLGDFLKLINGSPVEVCFKDKEPDKCPKFWTVLKDGVSNMETNCELDDEVYSIGVIYDRDLKRHILYVYVHCC